MEAQDGSLAIEIVKVVATMPNDHLPTDPETLIDVSEALWQAAEKKRGIDQLAGRLQVVELWLHVGSSSPLVAKKWGERMTQIQNNGATVSHVRDARVIGVEAGYSDTEGFIRDWYGPRESIEWYVDLRKGRYQLLLQFASFGKSGGLLFGIMFSIREAQNRCHFPVFRSIRLVDGGNFLLSQWERLRSIMMAPISYVCTFSKSFLMSQQPSSTCVPCVCSHLDFRENDVKLNHDQTGQSTDLAAAPVIT